MNPLYHYYLLTRVEVNGILDIARKTYLQSVEDIYEVY